MKKLSVLFLAVLLSIVISCGAGKKEVVVISLVPMTDTDAKATKNGMTVEVTAINKTNAAMYPMLGCTFEAMVKSILGEVKQKVNEPNVLAGTSFALKVTNNTGHIVKMSGSDITLSASGVDKNRMSKEELKQLWAAHWNPVPAEVLVTIDAIPFWDENAKILPGRTSDFFVTFNAELQQGVGQATMAVFDLVTNTDNAGNPTERTNFDFNFKEVASTIVK